MQRRTRWSRVAILATSAAMAALVQHGEGARAPTAYDGWADYGGSPDSMQYSSLAQVHCGNVARRRIDRIPRRTERKHQRSQVESRNEREVVTG